MLPVPCSSWCSSPAASLLPNAGDSSFSLDGFDETTERLKKLLGRWASSTGLAFSPLLAMSEVGKATTPLYGYCTLRSHLPF
jgi:hypothetical protein